MKITFGAKLITSPESFIKKTDTPEQQEHIKKVFRQLDSFLSLKKVDELSANDTVELVRSNGKKKFHYTINYRTPSNEEIIPIHMHCGNTPDNFHFYDNFYQLTQVIGYLNGHKRQVGERFNKFAARVYGLTPSKSTNSSEL